jgi:four helix bundle protein
MATIQRFEDLKVWQKARELSQSIYPLTFQEPIRSDFRFKDQIRGSLGSIMDNIAEGFGRGSRLEFITGLNTSRGETDELKSQLYRGFDNSYFSKEQFDEFYEISDQVTKMSTTLINYLNKSKIKGQRFKERI